MALRRTIVFSGRVQGVGFRMTAVQLAEDLPISGTVRNLPDGDVELVVEGESVEIDTLVSRLREHFRSFIRSIDQTPGGPLLQRFKGSGIRVVY